MPSGEREPASKELLKRPAADALSGATEDRIA